MYDEDDGESYFSALENDQSETVSELQFGEHTPLLVEYCCTELDECSTEIVQQEKDIDEEEEGIYRGPRVLIESRHVHQSIARCLLILWLSGGLSFLTCLLLCIEAKMMYLAFHTKGPAILIAAGTIVAVSVVVGRYYISILRTFMRLVRCIWHSSFGFSSGAMAVGNSNERRGWLKGFLKTTLILVLLVAGIGVPLWFAAIEHGYWLVIELLCSSLTLLSAATLLLVNFAARLARFINFIWRMHRDYWLGKYSARRLRASYLATVGLDTGRSLVDQNLEFIIWAVAVFMGLTLPLIVYRSTIDFTLFIITLNVCMPILGISVLLRVRRNPYLMTLICLPLGLIMFCCRRCRGEKRRICTSRRHERYSKVGERWFPVLFTFVVRAVWFAVSYAALAINDDYEGADKAEYLTLIPERMARLWNDSWYLQITIVHLAALLCRDLVFLLPLPLKWLTRPSFLVCSQFIQLAASIYGKILFPHSYLFLTQIFVALNSIDYREARRFWRSKFDYQASKYAGKKRGLLMVWLPIFLIIGSIFAGFMRSALSDYDVVGSPANVTDGNNERLRFSAPVCSLRFTPANLTVSQLALMSLASYEHHEQKIYQILHKDPRLQEWSLGLNSVVSFVNTTFNRTFHDRIAENGTFRIMTNGVGFAEFINHRLNISVIAIRGTRSLSDAFEDLSMWSTVLFLELSSYFGTLVRLWPVDFVARMVYWITNYVGNPNLVYWQDMESVAKEIIAKRYSKLPSSDQIDISDSVSSAKVLLTGHSLGGGLANIIAAHLNLPSVAFSAPGLGYSIYNYNLSRNALNDLTVNIVPLGDPIPMCDLQLGLVETIDCNASHPVACHLISRTTDTLYRICGP